MTDGIKDVIKAFTILGVIISIRDFVDTQRDRTSTGESPAATEQLRILRKWDKAFKHKGFFD